MAIETNLNVSPYYDDYDETKNFHRVLFRPAVPVQARELTQLQTILQNQIERFGQHQFKEGTIVKGCSFTFDENVKYVKLFDKQTNGLDVQVASFVQNDYITNSNNLIGQIVSTKSGLESQNPNLNTIFFHYTNTGDNGEKAYTAGEVLTVYPYATTVESVTVANSGSGYTNSDTITFTSSVFGSGAVANIVTYAANGSIQSINVTSNGVAYNITDVPVATINSANGTGGELTVNLKSSANVTIANTSFLQSGNTQFNVVGKSYQMSVADGIIFQKGNFQRFEDQSIIVSPYTNRPHELSVGFSTVESIVNNNTDASLLDNASGYANENAPGAHRLKLTPTLVVNTTSNAKASNNFLSIVRFESGLPVETNHDAKYSSFGDIMAKRTYEESGDYVVDSFSIGTEEIVGNTTHFSVVVGSGTAYVRGSRFQTVNPSRLSVKKASTFANIENQTISQNYGQYVKVNELVGQFEFDTADMVLILDAQHNSLSGGPAVSISSQSSNTLSHNSVTSNVIGTARVRSLELTSDLPGAGDSEYNLYLFDINMFSGKSFRKDAKAIHHYAGTDYGAGETNGSVRGIADIVLDGGVAELKDASFNTLVFPLGQRGIKSVGDATYIYKTDTDVTFASDGTATVSAPTGSIFNFGTSAATLSEVQEQQLLIIPNASVNATSNTTTSAAAVGANATIVTSSDTSDLEVGDLVYLNTTLRQVTNIVNSSSFEINSSISASPTTGATVLRTFQQNVPITLHNRSTANVVVGSSGAALSISLGVNVDSSFAATVVHDVKDTTSAALIKDYQTSYVKVDLNTNSGGTTGPWTLGLPDVHKIYKVYKHTAYTEDSAYDVTTNFDLVTNQRDGLYGLSKLKLKSTSSLSLTSADKLTIVVRHFVKNSSAGVGFFTYQSYSAIIDDADAANTSAITTQEIPVFTSPSSGLEYSLRDSIDFRPVCDATANAASTLAGATENPSATELFTGSQYFATPNEQFVSDIEYYLPRKDRIVIEEGELRVVSGTPSVNPGYPEKPDQAMQLATMDVPVYPSLDSVNSRYYSRPDLGSRINSTQLKRYTMNDIKKLDDRVKRLEYYTSLNMLEKKSAEQVIPGRTDPSLNRFKNGILVDNFSSITTGNPLNEEFKAGYDTARSLLTSRFETYAVQLKLESSTDLKTAARSGDIITLPYKERLIIDQNRATQFRKCTSKFWEYNGTLTLYPDYLSNVDTKQSPEAAMNIDVDVATPTLSLIEQLNKVAPTQFASDEVVADSQTTSLVNSSTVGLVTTDTYETVRTQTIERTTTSFSATTSTSTKKVGDFLTSIAFQPYIPGVRIRFVATGLRPNLRHYVYFDEVDVNEHVAPATLINTLNAYDSYNQISSSRIDSFMARSGPKGSALTSDSSGNIAGVLFLPANTFFAGERKVIVADVSNLDQIADLVSSASARFNCYNFTAEQNQMFISTRTALPTSTQSAQLITSSTSTQNSSITVREPDPIVIVQNTTPSNTNIDEPFDPPVTNTAANVITIQANTGVIVTPPPANTSPTTPARPVVANRCAEDFWAGPRWDNRDFPMGVNRLGRRGLAACGCPAIDPLAQSFLVETNAVNGADVAYLTSLNLYFAAKDPTQGVSVEIRTIEAGVPGPEVLPFSRVHLTSSQINTSTNGTVATTITFKAPVVVKNGTEYCFVVLPDGNSPNYSVFTSKVGQEDLVSGVQVNQDWGTGSMFLSTNNRSWKLYPDEDAKFSLYCAAFTATTGQATLVNEDYEFIEANNNTITGTFIPGEEVFQQAANQSGTVAISSGNNILVGTSTAFTSAGITAGSKIVLTDGTNHDVVRVATVANSTYITLYGAPTFTAASGKYQITPTGVLDIVDTNTTTIQLSQSTSTNSTFLFAAGSTIIGCDSKAQAEIGSIVDNNISYYEPQLYRTTPNGTRVIPTLSAKLSDSVGLDSEQSFPFNDRTYPKRSVKIMSKANEIVNNSGNKSVRVTHNLYSKIPTLSPTIDLQSQQLIVYENIINNDNTNEHAGVTGSATAKYISRRIELADTLDAEDIKVYLNAYRPSGTNIDVYAKILNQADTTSFEDTKWSKLQASQNGNVLSSSVDRSDVVEYTYEFADTPEATLKDGFVQVTSGSATVTGTGTTFSSDYAAGDLIKIINASETTDYQISKVAAVANNTSLTLEDTASFSITTGRPHYKVNSEYVNQGFRDPQASTDYTVTYYNSNGEKFEGYKYLAIKIVMRSDSTSKSPYVKDYRAIAVSL